MIFCDKISFYNSPFFHLLIIMTFIKLLYLFFYNVLYYHCFVSASEQTFLCNKTFFYYRMDFTVATTFSVVNPNFLNNTFAGADAPKPVMLTIAPSKPTYLPQP